MDPVQRIAAYRSSFLGSAEFALVLGMSQQAFANRMRRGQFPPSARLAMGPVWTKDLAKDQIIQFRMDAVAPTAPDKGEDKIYSGETLTPAMRMLLAHLDQRFPTQAEGEFVPRWRLGYVEICPCREKSGTATVEEIVKLMIKEFDKYAEGRTGILHWRIRPEFQHAKWGWKGYMRLKIAPEKA